MKDAAFYALILLIAFIYAVGLIHHSRECRRDGGVLVRGIVGWECVNAR